MKRLLDIWSRYVNQFDTVENWSNSVTYSCSQIKLLKDNIKEFGTDPVISSVRGSAANYKPKDPEFYRKLYKEKAMPFLRLETATPTETEKTIAELKKQLNERDKEIEELKTSVNRIQKLTEFLNNLEPEHIEEFFRYRMEHKQSLIEPPATIIEIPLTEGFEKRMKVLMERKEKEKKDKLYLNELLELSREASLEEKTTLRSLKAPFQQVEETPDQMGEVLNRQ